MKIALFDLILKYGFTRIKEHFAMLKLSKTLNKSINYIVELVKRTNFEKFT